MDAVKFLVTRDRMCKSFNSYCDGCKVKKRRGVNDMCISYTMQHPQEVVEIVEQWAKEHPKKTRQSEFLKQFPDAFVYLGSVDIDPCKIVKSKYDTKQCRLRETREWSCDNCREQFWHEEVE